VNTNPDSSPVKGFFCFFNRHHMLGVSRFMYQARCRANERRSIARIGCAKRARDPADPAAERVFRAGLPQLIRIEGPAPSRDWSFGFSLHAHRRLVKSKPRSTVEVPANPRCGGSKFGAASFSSGAPYRRGAAA
jgi:hypothetical protein